METESNGISSLWKKYKKTKDLGLRNKLIEKYLEFVKLVAWKFKERLPVNAELDDLVSAGTFGLMDAIDNFDLSRGVRFETYCIARVRGAMIDELRKMDWVSRLVRSRTKKYQKVITKIKRQSGNDNGHAPTPEEIASYLGVSIKEAEKIEEEGNAHIAHFFYIVTIPRERGGEKDPTARDCLALEHLQDSKQLIPEEELSKNEGFLELISFLSEEEQVVITLYYRDDFEMWKIGQVLCLTESRISQIHSRALQKIRDSLAL
jgi:RNA polymerase sigma factor for flagellar operon FliA